MNQENQPEYIGESSTYRTIRIRITDTCNFNCSYCVEHDRLPEKHMEQFDMIELLENLRRLHQLERRRQKLFIWGGEPTLNINLLWFLHRVRQYYHFITDIEIHSNLSGKYGPNFLDTLKDLNVKLSSSVHLEYKSKAVTIQLLCAHDIGILNEVNLMLHKLTDFEEVKKIKQYYIDKRKDFPISIVPTFQLQDQSLNAVKILLSESGEYKDRPIDCSDEPRNYIQIRNDINVEGYKCNVPNDSFIVDTDGIVYLCQNDLISGIKTKINFFTELTIDQLKTFNGTAICSYKKCDCEHIILKNLRK